MNTPSSQTIHLAQSGYASTDSEELSGSNEQKSALQRQPIKICLLIPALFGEDDKSSSDVGFLSRAKGLAADGHAVTILHIRHESGDSDNASRLHKEFATSGIRYVSPPAAQLDRFLCSKETALSWQAYQWLKQQHFDIIHCPESLGLPYYSLLAKHQGLAFQRTLFIVEILGPFSRTRMSENRHLDRVTDGVIDFLERRSAELADVVFTANNEVLDWVTSLAWQLPEKTFAEKSFEQSWRAWHQSVDPSRCVKPCTVAAEAPDSPPLVSVCLVHHNRPHYLKQALASIEAQDYPNIEVVLVDDGSTDPDALNLIGQLEPTFGSRGWQIVRQKNLYLGAARNNAAGHARGKYLLFMDDDNCAKPNEISTFVMVAERTGADVLTCQLDIFSGDDPPTSSQVPEAVRLSLGNALALGLFRNCFGDANALFRKESFWEVGGFTEDYGVGHEDWEILARAALSGKHVETVPECLVWYRNEPGTMLKSTVVYANCMRSLRPYLEALPDNLSELARFGVGLNLSVEQLLAEHAAKSNRLSVVESSADEYLKLLRANVQAHWHSKSLKLTAPFRHLFRTLRGMGPEPTPQARNIKEALFELDDMQSSLSWNLTAPFRAVLIARRRLLSYFQEELLNKKSETEPAIRTSKNAGSIIPDSASLAHSLVQKWTGGKIRGGPFAGMNYVAESIGSAFYPKLMGTYELELHDLTNSLCDEQFDALLNIGAGEGYYAVGMALRCPRIKIVAAEEDELRRQDLLLELAGKNGVSDRITLLGRCDSELLSDLVRQHSGQRILIIMDVEGYELKLLDPERIPQLKECTILVEVHDGRNTGPIGDELARRFYSSHDLSRIWFKDRIVRDLPLRRPFLDKHLLKYIDEDRKFGLCWQFMKPRRDSQPAPPRLS